MTDILDPQALANDLAAKDRQFAAQAQRIGHSLPIKMITVEDRHRSDMGDIDGLAASIRDNGLIQPVVVNSAHRLIAGHRRLEACKSLGMTSVPVYVVGEIEDASRLLRMERDENTCRKEMTLSEKVALGSALEALERPKALDRMGDRTDLTSGPTGPQVTQSHSRVRDVVGPAVGLSSRTYERARSIVNTSKDEALPAEVRDLATQVLEDVDAGALSISGAEEKVRLARKAANPSHPAASERPAPPPAPPSYGTRRKHDKKLIAIMTGLSGYQIVLDEIDKAGLDDSIGKTEADRLEVGFRTAIAALNRVRKLLQERTA